MSIQFKVEYEITPIRFVKVICPSCNEEFDAREHGTTENGGHIHDSVDLQFAKFDCPTCKEHFETRGKTIAIEEL